MTKDLNPGLLRRDNSEAGCRKSNMIFLSAALVAITLAAPTPPGGILTLAAGETERDAILLECCDLPDKQLVLTEADLDGIVSRFNGDVPIKLQHVDSPLDPFGAVTSVRRVGKQILGRIAFPPTIAALVRDRGAGALSCGLTRAPYTLAEVSLVVKGRLAAATLLDDTEQAELVRLRAETSKQRVDAQIVTLKLAGKIIPATEAAARVLLTLRYADLSLSDVASILGLSVLPVLNSQNALETAIVVELLREAIPCHEGTPDFDNLKYPIPAGFSPRALRYTRLLQVSCGPQSVKILLRVIANEEANAEEDGSSNLGRAEKPDYLAFYLLGKNEFRFLPYTNEPRTLQELIEAGHPDFTGFSAPT